MSSLQKFHLFWLPPLLAIGLCFSAAALALAPDELFLRNLFLIDRDDSIHLLKLEQISALRQALMILAAVCIAAALLLASLRKSVAAALSEIVEDARRFFAEHSPLFGPRELSSGRIFALILLIGFVARVATLNGPMRFDESDTFNYFGSRNFFSLLTDYTAPNNHLFHTIMLRASYLAFGDAPAALRLPAFLAGIAVMPLTFVVCRRLFDQPTAMLAMALAAAHPGLIRYSSNARGYTAVAVFTLIVLLAASFLSRRPSPFCRLVFVTAGVLGMFTIPVMIYPLAAVSIWALWDAAVERRPRLTLEIAVAALAIGALSVLLYAPAAMRTGVEAIVANRYVASLTWTAMAARLPQFFENTWVAWTNHLAAPFVGLLAVSAIVAFRSREARRLALVTGFSALALMGLQHVVPYARVFTYLAPIGCIVAAVGLREIATRFERAASSLRFSPAYLAPAVALILGASHTIGYGWFPTASEKSQRQYYRMARETLEQTQVDEVVLAAIPLSEPLRFLFLTHGRPRSQVLAPEIISGAVPPIDERESLVVVRPKTDFDVGTTLPAFRIDLRDPAFESFSAPRLILQTDYFEVVRLHRRVREHVDESDR